VSVKCGLAQCVPYYAEHPARRLADRRARCGDDVGFLDLFAHGITLSNILMLPNCGASPIVHNFLSEILLNLFIPFLNLFMS